MTREELVEIMKTNTYRDAADKICAALESERDGEVVLGEGRLISVEPHPCGPTYYACNKNYSGRDGVLTFRPTKAEKGGE